MKRRILWCAFGISVISAAVYGHHSIAGVYDTGREVTIDGVIREFHFVNPHPYLIVDVKTPGGAEPWKLEMDNRFELVQIGMDGQTLKKGDRVVVIGSPVRPPQSQGLYIRKLDRDADGFQYEQVGASPRIRASGR